MIYALAADLFSMFYFDWRIFTAFFIFGALMPDIDTAESYVGRWARPFSWFVRHRGLFHSLPVAGLFSIAISFFNISYGLAFFLGYASHLMLDGLNHKGVALFYPFFRARLSGPLKSGGLADRIIYFLSIAGSLAALFFKISSMP